MLDAGKDNLACKVKGCCICLYLRYDIEICTEVSYNPATASAGAFLDLCVEKLSIIYSSLRY